MFNRLYNLILDCDNVSVSLRSIVHSYNSRISIYNKVFNSFRLLTEYRSFLCLTDFIILFWIVITFPSPYGVSFILIIHAYPFIIRFSIVSVSLRSIVHSYPYCFLRKMILSIVSVSLRSIVHSYLLFWMVSSFLVQKFPSPYGVSFILIISLMLVSLIKAR